MARPLAQCLCLVAFFTLGCATRTYAPPPPSGVGISARAEDPSVAVQGAFGAGGTLLNAQTGADVQVPIDDRLRLHGGAALVGTYDAAFTLGAAGLRYDLRAPVGIDDGPRVTAGVGVVVGFGPTATNPVRGAFAELGLAGSKQRAQPFFDTRLSWTQLDYLDAERLELNGGVDLGGRRASVQLYGGLELFTGTVRVREWSLFSDVDSVYTAREADLLPRLGIRVRFGLHGAPSTPDEP